MSSNDCHLVVEPAPYSRRENRVRLTPEGAAIVRTGDGLLAAALEQILPEPDAAYLGPTIRTLTTLNAALGGPAVPVWEAGTQRPTSLHQPARRQKPKGADPLEETLIDVVLATAVWASLLHLRRQNRQLGFPLVTIVLASVTLAAGHPTVRAGWWLAGHDVQHHRPALRGNVRRDRPRMANPARCVLPCRNRAEPPTPGHS